jgi:hypothetical protein
MIGVMKKVDVAEVLVCGVSLAEGGVRLV